MSQDYTRFSVNQRLQHIFMFVPFIILVLTGFPIKFPESEFWSMIMSAAGGIDKARVIHRFAAGVMILDFSFHILYVFYNLIKKRPSLSEMHLLPNKRDGQNIIQNIKYFLFLSDERPRFHKFSYIEKFDYWAVFWGMFIMAGSGLVLWFPVQVSTFLPGIVIQIAYVAHSDEAMLALLAIIIWHFYNVHFNPRIWPANKVWFKGTLTEEEMEYEHPLELEEIKAKEEAST